MRRPFVFCVLIFCGVAAADSPTTRTFGTIERFDDRLSRFVADDAVVEWLAGGFEWTEGPLWVADPEALEGPRAKGAKPYLLFSDIPRNSVMKFSPHHAADENNGISLFLKPSGYTGAAKYGQEPGCNGLTLDPKGRLISCEHGDRRVSVLTVGGGKMTIADRYEGKRFNSPNDAVVDSRGILYFTDPPYGLPAESQSLRELDACGVYRIDVAGGVTLLTNELTRPNGIGLSPDEKTLYVAQSDSDAPLWMAYPLHDDGTMGAGTEIANAKRFMADQPGAPDGLDVHSSGVIFSSGPGGVYVMTGKGEMLGRFVTGTRVSNCTLTDDESALYITADDDLCRVSLLK